LLILTVLESNYLHIIATQLTTDALLIYVVVDPVVILRNADAREELKALRESLKLKRKD